jgi:ATP-binding cassette subfamily B protein
MAAVPPGAPDPDEGSPRPSRALLAPLAGAFRLAWTAAPGTVATAVAVQIATAVCATAQLLIGRWLLSELLGTDETAIELDSALPAVAALVAVTTVMAVGSVLQSSSGMVLTEAIGRHATGQLLDVAATVEPAAYEDPSFHDHLERARFNATSRPVMAVNGLLGVLGATSSAVGIAIALLVIEPVLVPLALMGAVPAWFAGAINSRRYHRFTKLQTPDDRLRSYLMHVLSNRDLAKELRVYGAEAELRRRYDELYDARLQAVRALARSRRRFGFGAAVGAALVMLLSLAVLFWAVEDGRIGLASAGTALFALLFLGQRLRVFVASAGVLYEAALFIEDVETFRSLAPSGATAPDETAEPLPAFEVLRAEHLRFRYPGAEAAALDGIDLELRRGETVALVGENGSGKTTLAKILLGIYRPTEGRLVWDGLDLTTIDPARLRRSAAVVFQDLARFQLSARDNVALGDVRRLDDEAAMVAAASGAGADDLVAALPRGWDQILSRLFEGGVDLSGGEWQRLALARALFRDAPFLVMDEPSAALDARAETALFAHLREIAEDRTVLFISHRFSTVRLADRIYVMADGQVVEQGTHDDLMARDGHYAEMYRLQASMYGPSVGPGEETAVAPQ